MIIEGTYTLQATPEDVWRCLMDEQILRTTHAAPEVIEYSHVQITDEQLNEHSVTQSSDTQPTFLHRVVHLSGLGEGDPLLEELWVSRVKRYGTLMGLLLLVLLGTRLPRLFSH